MLIGSYPIVNGNVAKLNIYIPTQTLLLRFKRAESYSMQTLLNNFIGSSLSVRLQDSATGKKDELIPYTSLLHLAELSTYNQGVIIASSTDILIPVMLNPAGNIKLDNSKFLEIELMHVPGVSVDVFAIATKNFSDFVTRYEKLSIPQGTTRQSFDSKNLEAILLPHFYNNMDLIRLYHSNGVVQEMTKDELRYHMAITNDLTAVITRLEENGSLSDDTTDGLVASYFTSAIINLSGVDKIEVIRESYATEGSYEILTVDFK